MVGVVPNASIHDGIESKFCDGSIVPFMVGTFVQGNEEDYAGD